MKKQKHYFNLIMCLFFIPAFFIACAGEEPLDEEEEIIETPVDTLCEGNGDNSFWPLAIGNEWEYEATGAEVKMKVTGTEVKDGIEYFSVATFVDGNQIGLTEGFLRNDAAGNTYLYTSDEGDVLYIPASPVVGNYFLDMPDGSGTFDREVDFFGTPDDFVAGLFFCNYTSVLFINEYSNVTGNYMGADYYVRGVGPVYDGGWGDELIDVILH